MNGAYLHLAMNHIPVVGFPLCFALLTAGALRGSRDVIQAGFAGLILLAIITVPVWKTGGPAAHTLFTYPGVTLNRQAVHEHAEAGEFGVISGGVLGVLALIGWWLSRRPEGTPKVLLILTILGALFVSVCMARIAHLGGLIRHPEIEAAPAQ
jgi:hypothetical protein